MIHIPLPFDAMLLSRIPEAVNHKSDGWTENPLRTQDPQPSAHGSVGSTGASSRGHSKNLLRLPYPAPLSLRRQLRHQACQLPCNLPHSPTLNRSATQALQNHQAFPFPAYYISGVYRLPLLKQLGESIPPSFAVSDIRLPTSCYREWAPASEAEKDPPPPYRVALASGNTAEVDTHILRQGDP